LPKSRIASVAFTGYDLPVNFRTPLAVLTLAFIVAGCASSPRVPQVGGPHERARSAAPVEAEPTAGEKAVSIAARFLGTPYRYGGDSPQGFDCSGLVFYSFEQAGLKVPRTAADQRKAAEHVRRSNLEPGDLLFFRSSKGRIDHVGIYAGDGRFIHAPNAGSVVSYAYLDQPYYRSHYVSAGRF
jgi:cell wall-associated NlpC family hydrolase